MAFKLGDVIIDRIQYGVAEDCDGNLLYTLSQLTEATINISAESKEAKDKDGTLVTHRAVKVTKSGKVMFARTDRGHFLTEKSQSRKRKLRRAGVLSKTQSKNIKRLINA